MISSITDVGFAFPYPNRHNTDTHNKKIALLDHAAARSLSRLGKVAKKITLDILIGTALAHLNAKLLQLPIVVLRSI